MQQNCESIEDQAESPSCNCNRSFSEEMAEWGQSLRVHWFIQSKENWTKRKQFVFTFLGALTFFFSVFTFSLTGGVVNYQFSIFSTTYYSLFIIITILAGFYGFILAWIPRKTSPVRLYLSGVTLPALVMFIVFLPSRYQGGF